MKRLSTVFSLALLFAVPAVSLADGCYICSGGSSCQQCRYGAKDTQDARKACEKKGCKIGGTASCSTAANVKVCAAPAPQGPPTASLDADIAWCVPG
jgi:hypothetical protein